MNIKFNEFGGFMGFERIKDAISFAMYKHNLQMRKVKRSYYFWHPLNVARFLNEVGAEEEEIIAGVLHDLLEDTTTKEEEIKSRYGSEVLRLVNGVSVLKYDDVADREKRWLLKKKEMIKKIKEGDVKIKRIKLMDTLDNVFELYRDNLLLGGKVWEFFNADKEKQRWYYYEMLRIFKDTEFEKEQVYVFLLEELLDRVFM